MASEDPPGPGRADDAAGPTGPAGPDGAAEPTEAAGTADAAGGGAPGAGEASAGAEGTARDRRIRLATRAAAVLAAMAALFALFLALPYGAAATVMKPALNLLGSGPGLPADLDAPAERSVVLAGDGSVLATLSGEENRVTADLDEVPEQLRSAVLAIEDADFYDHAGVDHRAVVRALFANVLAGRTVQGASTITQQYIKNAVLSSDRTVERKTTEMRYAIDLERRLSKDEILERYLNVAYFGEGVYGIATAAEYYYSKSLDELTLDEAALLAGLISQPERTNPADDVSAAVARRDTVLARMAEEGMISSEEADAAQRAEVELELRPLPPPDDPFFVTHVTRLLFEDEALGETRDERQRAVFSGGLRVLTTLDPVLQEEAEAAIGEVLTDPVEHPLGSLVTLDTGTGAIRVLATGPKEFGGCEDEPEDEPCPRTRVNPAVPDRGGSGRQPGSAFKPMVIATALDEGIPRGWQEVTDSETQIEGCDDYAPRNFDPTDGGDKEMYEAVTVSNNVYHAALIGRVQPEPVVEMAQRLGIDDGELPEECSLALGSATIFPIDMATAFATFANEGVRCEPYAVQRIERDGEVLREHEPVCEEAISPELAHQVTDLLRGPVESGTAVAAQLDRPVAGKTGTTDDYRDAWFVGYVPQLVTSAWVGFEEQQPMEDILGLERVTGGTIPAEIWAAFMQVAVEGLDAEDFPEPPRQRVLTVPDAIERDVDEVIDHLEEYDFHVETEQVVGYQPAGTVIGQEPEPGTEVPRGHFLRMAVSDGTGDPPEVPDVTGMDEDEARETLEDAEYEVEVETEEREATLGPDDDPADLDPPDGAVERQDPRGGTPLEPGETVTITVVRYDIERREPADAVEIAEIRPAQDPDREYVEVRNEGAQPVEVSGWSIVTDGGDSLEIGSPYVLPPGDALRVYTGEGSDRADRYFNGRDEPVLDPDGGTVALLDEDLGEVHRARY